VERIVHASPTTNAGSEPLGAASPAPRIGPGTPAEIGRVNFLVARVLGLAMGSGPPHIFTTLARHRGLFRRWLRFAGALMPGGSLPRADTELLILRTANNAGCEYEWRHHERLGQLAGLSGAQVQQARGDHDAPVWSARQRLLLMAADELHAERTISDGLWDELRPLLSDSELIELCMLVGHYEMLAMTVNALQVTPDELLASPPPRALRALQAAVERRQRVRGSRR
jgi:alkylhydroperoxidase family enzyme